MAGATIAPVMLHIQGPILRHAGTRTEDAADLAPLEHHIVVVLAPGAGRALAGVAKYQRPANGLRRHHVPSCTRSIGRAGRVLDLDPALRPAAAVGGIPPLRHDAL